MVPIQRETLITAGILVCIVAAIFLFKELGEVKDQLNHVTMMNQRLTHHANQINQAMMAAQGEESESDDEDEEEEVKIVPVTATPPPEANSSK
mgnify:FL=1|tara:strand:- start:1530 stop:1808 length:279 start_codon:yes stop_codon:yes gene_type:complete